MYNGVKEMMKAEMELMKANGVIFAGSHLKKNEDLSGFVQFPATCKSLISKNLTQEVWNKYKGQKDKVGVPFESMILSGC